MFLPLLVGLRILLNVTYAAFLKECRRLAGVAAGREIGMAEFGRLCQVNERYYTNKENGVGQPGRELLETAAACAGLRFEDCISIPDRPRRNADPERIFRDSLYDHRERAALRFAAVLAGEAKPKRPKTGGRKRKSG